MIIKGKQGLQISFSWLFAIIVGAFILSLAIYAATKVINTGGEAGSAKTGAEIGALLNPLETGFEASKVILLSIPVDTRIYNNCKTGADDFGEQEISISQKNFNKWTETEINTGFKNKYIFSENPVQGKDFFLFSKPFEFPFKISDVIYMTSSDKKYCFSDAPNNIKEELSKLNEENLFVENCPSDSIKICFNNADNSCDVVINENLKSVEKRGQVVYYETDALMYAAVFSDKETYECNVKRLIQREKQLALIYDDKTTILSKQSCPADVNLIGFSSLLGSYQSSASLSFLANEAESLKNQNKVAECRLW